jgi:hypothetical protein
MSPPDVIVASATKQGSVTVPKILDEAQLTLLTAISALAIPPIHALFPKIKYSIKPLERLNSYSRAMITRLE